MSSTGEPKRITIPLLLQQKERGEKVAMLTAYDAFTASLIDRAGIDILLVGDSAANVVHGHSSTLPISLETMLTHTAAVVRGTRRALVIGDMPFLSYQPSVETAITNAGRFLKEAGAQAIKLEGGIEYAPTVERLVAAGIPVMGHIGLTPQSIHRFGGPKVQGRTEKSVTYLKESALALQAAGCFAIVLELVEAPLAEAITRSLHTALTIGIGAGKQCDGQVLVTNDMLGLRDPSFRPKFLREYANLSPVISDAVIRYIADVKGGQFPGESESYQ